MLKLILMRHAKSSWDDPHAKDIDRPLNKRGVNSAKAMGHWLRNNGHVPDAVLSSSSRRTMQTFEHLALTCPVAFTKHLYHASEHGVLDQLQQAKDESILLLGHNPGIGDFAEGIAKTPPSHPDFERFPTCATLVVTFESASWENVAWAAGNVIDFAVPRDVINAQTQPAPLTKNIPGRV